jgi:hypothetical protein
MKHTGSCHCGAVQFTIEAPTVVTVQHCNCSMCDKIGFVHLITAKSAFELTSGEDNLSKYTFNTHVAQHLFCKTCGVESFYVPRSNPDGYSINFNCLDHSTFTDVTHEDFDGQNWEQNAARLSHLSQEKS